MIEIDGSMHSGSGTVLRYAVSLAGLLGEPLRIRNIRVKRDKPGLRPQHLQAVRACAEFCGGTLRGAEVNSRELVFAPGPLRPGGEFRFDIGTAGSTTMLAFTLIPLALAAERPSRFTVSGGLFQDFAPSAFHMRDVLARRLAGMGAEVRIGILRPGYVPKGGGLLSLEVEPLHLPLSPLRLTEQGPLVRFRGTALASNLREAQVAERMAQSCRDCLPGNVPVEIETVDDRAAFQRGAALHVAAETGTGCLIGADRAGKAGRQSEAIGEFVAARLLEDLGTGATVDRHLADQVILFAALAGGASHYRAPVITDHVESNLWLVETLLGARTAIDGNLITIDGIGFER